MLLNVERLNAIAAAIHDYCEFHEGSNGSELITGDGLTLWGCPKVRSNYWSMNIRAQLWHGDLSIVVDIETVSDWKALEFETLGDMLIFSPNMDDESIPYAAHKRARELRQQAEDEREGQLILDLGSSRHTYADGTPREVAAYRWGEKRGEHGFQWLYYARGPVQELLDKLDGKLRPGFSGGPEAGDDWRFKLDVGPDKRLMFEGPMMKAYEFRNWYNHRYRRES